MSDALILEIAKTRLFYEGTNEDFAKCIVNTFKRAGWLPPEAVQAVRDKALEEVAVICEIRAQKHTEYIDAIKGQLPQFVEASEGMEFEAAHIMQECRALQSRAQPSRWQEVPDGYVVVPREPTRIMLESGVVNDGNDDSEANTEERLRAIENMCDVYRAMIGAKGE